MSAETEAEETAEGYAEAKSRERPKAIVEIQRESQASRKAAGQGINSLCQDKTS